MDIRLAHRENVMQPWKPFYCDPSRHGVRSVSFPPLTRSLSDVLTWHDVCGVERKSESMSELHAIQFRSTTFWLTYSIISFCFPVSTLYLVDFVSRDLKNNMIVKAFYCEWREIQNKLVYDSLLMYVTAHQTRPTGLHSSLFCKYSTANEWL